MKPTTDLAVIEKTYDMLIWTHRHVQKFPRHSRYSAGARLESKLTSLLDALITAKFSKAKLDVLQEAAMTAEQLRLQFRFCVDTQLISRKSHEFAARCLVDISKQIHGWRKQRQSLEN